VLDSMRKGARDSVALKVVFGAIVVVFVFWGIGTVGFDERQIAARVNEQVISAATFERVYQNLARAYREASPANLPEEFLRQRALDQLITVEILNQEAARLGLEVGEDELRESIAAVPTFQIDGRFSKDLYLRTLQANGFKPADFEDMQRREVLATKLQQLVLAGVHVSETQLLDLYRHENARVTVRFLRVPASRFIEEVTIGEDDVAAYFAENQERFREPERARISHLVFEPDFFRAQVEPSDQEVADYYEAHLDEYRQPEEARVRQILLKRPPDASEDQLAELRQRANGLLEKARAGEDFAALARESSEDMNAESGGDLGWVGRGVLDDAVEEAAFALEPRGISDLIETDAGIVIVAVEEKRAERVEPLDSVRASIEDAVRAQRARGLALQRAEEAHEKLVGGGTLEDVATGLGLSVQTPPPFARTEPVGDMGRVTELIDVVFATPAGEVGEIVTLDSGYVVFRLTELIASHVPELAQVRSEAESQLREKRAKDAARVMAEELLERLKGMSPPDLDAVAAAEGLTVEESGPIGRIGPYVPNLGNAPQLKDAAFRLTSEAPVAPAAYEVGSDSVIAVLQERIPADESRFAEDREALEQRVRQQEEAAILQQFLSALRKKAVISIAPGIAGGPDGLT
jgi:peptidyl-prolyl cis-trans isomerase D